MTDPAMALLADPQALPFKLDPLLRRVLWLRLDADMRRSAAFLDERAMPASPQGGWAPLDWLERVQSTRPAHAIFHIGHCGSTLLSRLLEAGDGVEGLREPLPLRTLADAWPRRGAADAWLSDEGARHTLAGLWHTWSRPLDPASQVVVKATSRCTPLIEPLLAAFPAMRVVLLDMPLRPWLATLFKSDASLADALAPAGERLTYLHARGLARRNALHALSLPAHCALGWLAEQLRFDELAASHAERVMRVDFEQLLALPGTVVPAVVSHLGLPASTAEAALASPHWHRYSKAPEHDYRIEDRRHDLELAARRFTSQVQAGVDAVEAIFEADTRLRAGLAARLG